MSELIQTPPFLDVCCAEAVAGLMAAFIAANHPATAPEACEQAVDQLLEATRTSFELLTPLSLAAGRGSPAAVLAGQAVQAGEAAAYAFGNERLPLMNAMHGSLMHPGELAAAERFARDVQRRMLAAGMSAGAAKSVRVAVTVHPRLEPFIYSQPMVFKTGACLQRLAAHPAAPWEQ